MYLVHNNVVYVVRRNHTQYHTCDGSFGGWNAGYIRGGCGVGSVVNDVNWEQGFGGGVVFSLGAGVKDVFYQSSSLGTRKKCSR